MIQTEDDIAKDLRAGEITVTQALDRLSGDDVLVYGSTAAPATWGDVENAMSGASDLLATLAWAGATPIELDRAEAEIRRLRDQGSTIESRY